MLRDSQGVNEAGSFVIVPPGWQGDLPAGLPTIDAPTTIVSIVGRYACLGPADIPNVIALQEQLSITPTDPSPPAPAGIPDVGAVADGLEFFELARVLSQRFPEVAEDAEYASRFAALGVADESSPYVDPDPAFADELIAGLAAGKEQMEAISRHGKAPVVNGWTVGLHMFDYNLYALGLGTIDEPAWKMDEPPQMRFALRAVADRLGLWGNNGYEAVYCQAFTDVDGEPLTGSLVYTMTFPEPPPVGAFWSITMYSIPDYYLVDNPIDRFSIGDRTDGIQYDGDGALTITISHAEPTDATARANWLPAPDEKFRLVFRLYIPGAPIIDGTYQFPSITRTSS